MLEGNVLSSVVTNVCALGCGIFLGFTLRRFFRSEFKFKHSNMKNSLENIPEAQVFSDCNQLGQDDYKLVLVVQNGLKMGKGKMAAQCAHASVMAYQHCFSTKPSALKKWLKSGQRKVVLKVDTDEALLSVAENARRVGLITSLVCDAGRTQIAAGSRTVLGIGPGPEQFIDRITGHLKLL